MELQHLDFEFSIHIRSWITNEVNSLALRGGKILINNVQVSEINAWYGFRRHKFIGLLDTLAHEYPSFFEIPVFSDVRATLSPASYEWNLARLLQFQEHEADVRLYKEYDQLRSKTFFEIAPVDLVINGNEWVVPEDLSEPFLHPREWTETLYLLSNIDQEEKLLFGRVNELEAAFLHYNEKKGLSWEIVSFKNGQLDKPFEEFREFAVKRIPALKTQDGYLNFIDVAISEAARTEDLYCDVAVEDLFKCDSERADDSPILTRAETLRKYRRLRRARIKVQIDRKFGERFVDVFEEVFLADWAVGKDSLSTGRELVLSVFRKPVSNLPCVVDASYQRVRGEVTDYRRLSEDSLLRDLDLRSLKLRSQLAGFRNRLAELQAKFGAEVTTFNHACNVIERYEFVHSPEYTKQLWLDAYEIRNNPASKIAELEASLENFKRAAAETVAVRAELGWPADWPPLLAPVWKTFGAKPGSPGRWHAKGWDAAEVLLQSEIRGCGGLLLVERLNFANPPLRADV